MFFNDIKKVPRAIIGFMIMAFGTYLIKSMEIGMSPWDTLFLGIEKMTNLRFGQITQLVGFLIILVSCIFKMYPGMGTLMNMFFFGLFLDVYAKTIFIEIPQSLFLKTLYIIVGQFLLFYGIYIYLSCHFGAGPRDGLLIIISRLTNKTIGVVKICVELFVLIIGWMLGGKVGLGTLLITLLSGIIFEWVLKCLKYCPQNHKHTAIQDYLKLKW